MVRGIPMQQYLAVVRLIVELRNEGLTYAEIDAGFNYNIRSYRWMNGRRTREYAKQLGLIA